MYTFTIYSNKLQGRIDPLYYSKSTFELTNHFKFSCKKLSKVALYFKTGFAAGKQDQDETQKGIIQIRPTNIDEEGNLSFVKNIYINKSSQKMMIDLLQKGEVLFNNTNSQELVGKTAYFDLEGKYFCSNHITRIGVNRDVILPEYLQFILNFYQRKKLFFNICTNWNNQSGVNIELLKTIDIPVPEIIIQKQIISILNNVNEKKRQKEKEAQELFNSIDSYVLHELGIELPKLEKEITFIINSEEIKDKRIDPYYYQQKFSQLYEMLKKIKTQPLGELIDNLTGGATPDVTGDFYLKSNGIPFLRVQNITKEGINLNDVKFIKPDVHENQLKRSQLKKDDIIFTITGRIGNAAVVPENFIGNINQHSVRFHLKDSHILPEYLAIFFNTNFGNRLSLRGITGGTRPALDYQSIKNLLIPTPSIDIQNKIVNNVKTINSQAKTLQQEALESFKNAKEQVEKIILGDSKDVN